MVFSSVIFLFYFLPVLIIVYRLSPQRYQNAVMVAASAVFFAWGEIRFIPIFFVLSAIDYFCGLKMEKYRDNQKKRLAFMLIDVCSWILALVFFKYTNFIVSNLNGAFGLGIPDPRIMLPLGVSFNSFQAISYAIDVYRGTTKAEKKFIDYLCFTTLFPQVIAGPIVRYVAVVDDLDNHQITVSGFSAGMRRFILGLCKKVLIANNVGFLWAQISTGQAGEPTVLLYWLGILAYTFQIYFDFSGYSDMAIGLGKVFGFTFWENFDTPYISRSITEFWRRWHMTLGNWFRDYVYIPLGGNRKGNARQMLNILVVWALTGLWHGASWNFVIWGIYFAFLLVLEKFILFRFLQRLPRFFQHLYTMLLVIVSWVIFASEDFAGVTMAQYLTGMFGFDGLPAWNSQALFYLLEYAVIFIMAVYFSTPHIKKLLAAAESKGARLFSTLAPAGYIIAFLACVAAIVNSSYNPFLYFRF